MARERSDLSPSLAMATTTRELLVVEREALELALAGRQVGVHFGGPEAVGRTLHDERSRRRRRSPSTTSPRDPTLLL
jgi:hypothetical protein